MRGGNVREASQYIDFLHCAMKATMRVHWSRLCAVFAALWLLASPALAVEVGEPAPGFLFPTAKGGMLGLDDLRGQVVYLDFWASWCAPCRRSFPWMNEIQQRYGERGFKVVALNVDRKRADAERFLKEYPAAFDVIFDHAGLAPGAYGVKAMPSAFLIDTKGRIAAVAPGFLDEHRAPMEAKIRALLDKR